MKNFLSDKLLEKENDLDSLPFQLGWLRRAINYQKWTFQAIEPFLGDRILEVGAGIGNMSRWLPLKERLIFSEIEPDLFCYLERTKEFYFENKENVDSILINVNDNWSENLAKENIDTIVSFNVMEHVKDDREFFAHLVNILKKSKSNKIKRIITFVPAHQFLHGTVDKYYGHFRRYSHKSLKKLKNQIVPEADFYYRYFNLVGLPGWFLLGKILRKKGLSKKSINSFERICPLIKYFDDFLHLKLKVPFGQSVLSVVTLK